MARSAAIAIRNADLHRRDEENLDLSDPLAVPRLLVTARRILEVAFQEGIEQLEATRSVLASIDELRRQEGVDLADIESDRLQPPMLVEQVGDRMDVLELDAIAWAYGSAFGGNYNVSDLYVLGSQNIGLGAVLVVKTGNTGCTVWVIFDSRNDSRHI